MNREELKINTYLLIFTLTLFLSSLLLALKLSEVFIQKNLKVFENPEAVENSLYYFVLILIFTGFILLIIRKRRMKFLKGFFLLLIFYSLFVTLSPVISSFPSFILSLSITVLVYSHPEWWVIDLTGVLLSAIAIALFGISMGVLPAIILLVVLAVYDFISVYRTEHMLSMAKGVLDLKIPILFVIPVSKGYSFIRGGREGAVFLGLGDVVIPSILVISSNFYLEAPRVLLMNLISLCTLIGTLIGFFTLFFLTSRGKAHPGLPFLNGGAILGFLLGLLLT